jgi:FkbM family methyltransferase
MFKFIYNRSDIPNKEGCMHVREGEAFFSVETIASNYLKPEELPITLCVFDLWNNLNWQSGPLYPGMFCSYSDSYNKKISVRTATGRQVFDWEWDAVRDGDVCHQVFENWVLSNKNTKGLVIGSNDGNCGEWVMPTFKGDLSAVIVEPSDKAFEILNKNWGWRPSIHLEKTVVTKDGSDVSFWEGEHDSCNSLIKSHSANYNNELVEKKMSSTTIKDLTTKWNISGKWWLHLDVEGYDDELIYSLDISNLPDIIVFEHVNFSDEQRQKLLSYLESLGYFTQLCYMNGVSTRITS